MTEPEQHFPPYHGVTLRADHPAIVNARDLLVQLKGYFAQGATLGDKSGVSKRYAQTIETVLGDLEVARK